MLERIIEEERKLLSPLQFHQTHKNERTVGERCADVVASFTGSWKFILGYIGFTVLWIVYNTVRFLHHFDPFPFIFYTFSVSVLAILMSAIILLSQNRQADIDRAHAENSYRHVDDINVKQDKQLKQLTNQDNTMIKQHNEMKEMIQKLLDMNNV